jgi:hypothetical protein
MAEIGHTDPKLTLKVCAQVMRRDHDETTALKRLVDGKPQKAPERQATAALAAARKRGRRSHLQHPVAATRKVPK